MLVGRNFKLLTIKLGDAAHQVIQAALIFTFDGWRIFREGAGRRSFFTLNFKTYGRRQLFNGLRKLHTLIFHDKVDGIAMSTTAEAVIELFFLTDTE
ncbi:Uncharacterised protein [Vibrio cholerae]|nr:Uncharacterised protein [Vibrio cholerae]